MKRIVVSAAIVLSMAGTAFAQTSTAPAPTRKSEASPTANTGADASSAGVRMADTAAVSVRFVNVQPADFMATRVIGASVYNKQDESVGEIEDLVIDNGKMVKGIVIGVSRFLGLGETHVVLDPSAVVLSQQDGKWRAYVDMTKDTLKDAPRFTYSKMRK